MISHSEGAKRGSLACLQNHTASQQLHGTRKPTDLRALTEENKQTSLHSSRTAVKSHQKRILPFVGGAQPNSSHPTQPRTSPQICLPFHLPAISIGFSLFRLSLLPASEICAPKAALRSRSVSLPVLRDLKREHTR